MGLNLDFPKVPSFFLIHGVVLWICWSILALLQIGTNRYWKHHWQINIWLHRVIGMFIMLSTLFYGIYGWWKLQKV